MRYLAAAGIGALVAMIVAAAATFAAQRLGFRSDPTEALLHYQLAKIALTDVPDTVFLGDSSLGNAIDAAYWQQRTGRPARSFALTAGFGYEADYNLLRRILARGRPQVVVFMHTGDLLQRPPPSFGYWATSPDLVPRLAFSLYSRLNASTVRDSMVYLGRYVGWSFLGAAKPAEVAGVEEGIDYIPQSSRRRRDYEETPVPKWMSNKILARNVEIFRKISALCRENGLTCLYAHGPLVMPWCEEGRSYFEDGAEQIAGAGLDLLSPFPLCLPPEHVGDTEDHVAPRLKRLYTDRYIELISARVDPNPAGSAGR